MNDVHSLSHSKWNCKYHIVFAPKYRRKVFYAEKRLEIGDMIYLTDRFKGKLEYYIFEKQIVNPKDVNCLSQETEGNIELTLITCTSDSMNRIIIKARVNGY